MRPACGASTVVDAPTVDGHGGAVGALTSGTAGGPDTDLVEIVCDESGSEGEKLIGGSTDVFTHASLDIELDSALACIDEVRLRARSPAEECKAGVVLRERNRPLLEWLLGPSGPMLGRGHVHVTDKALHLVHRMVELLWPPDTTADERRVAAHHIAAAARPTRTGDAQAGSMRWHEALAAFNDLMRARELASARPLCDHLRAAVNAVLDGTGPYPAEAAALCEALASTVRTDADLARLIDKSDAVSVLDPLVPALGWTVRHWAASEGRVFVVHDVQDALTAERIEQVERFCGRPALAGVCFVDSQHDPRIQVADFLAGAARKIASDELSGNGDAALLSLLAPYVDRQSVWARDGSPSDIGPASGVHAVPG